MNINEYTIESAQKYFAINVQDNLACMPVEAIVDKWRGVNIWVMHECWDKSKIKIPYHYLPLKALGIFASKLFLLCVSTHSFDEDPTYKNASQWFHQTLMELCRLEIDQSLNGKIEPLERSWTKGFIDSESKRLQALKNNKNPYKAFDNCNALVDLFDKALKLKKDSGVYYDQVWKKFIDAYAAYIKDLKTNPRIKHAFIKSDFYTMQVKGGKSEAYKKKIANVSNYPMCY